MAADDALDALAYALANAPRAAWDRPPPPPTPPGLTPEQHAAHLTLHGLVSVEEFSELRKRVGFVLLTPYWGAIGKDRFCCDEPVRMEAPWAGIDYVVPAPKAATQTRAETWNYVRKWLGFKA